MSANNICIFAGNLTRDPEGKSVGDARVVKFSIAVNERHKDRTSGEWVNKPFYAECEAWNGTGEFVEKHFKKGEGIIVRGRARLEAWEKDGEKRSKTTFRVEEAGFSPGKGGGRDEGPAPAPQGKKGGGGKKSPPADTPSGDNGDDMDIPF